VGLVRTLNGLEVAFLGEASSRYVGQERGGVSKTRGRVEFTSEDRKKGGPPGL